MNSRDNCISIIDDNDFNHYTGEVKCTRTKNGYKLKYEKEGDFFNGREYDTDDMAPLFIVGTIIIVGLQLACLVSIPCIWIWCVIPLLCLGFIGYVIFNSKKEVIGHLYLSIWYFIVSILVSWFCLISICNSNFYNTTSSEWGRKMDKYTKEHVDPNLVFLKR